MELMKAHRQWANRPADERYWDLPEMLAKAKIQHANAVELPATLAEFHVEVKDEELVVVGKQGMPAVISNHAFGQLAGRVGAPANYLTKLPEELAAKNLNYGLQILGKEMGEGNITEKLLLDVHAKGRGSELTLRAMTTQKYKRVWNEELLLAFMQELPQSFRTPRARPSGVEGERTRLATSDDVMPGSLIRLGEKIAPAGAYLGDKDMFILVIDTAHTIDDGTESPLHKGFMLWNSEVGARTIGGMFFRFKQVCGNHIIWGASDVLEFSHRHMGKVAERVQDNLRGFRMELKKYADDSVSEEEGKIQIARKTILGKSKEEVVQAILTFIRSKKIDRLNKKLLDASYDVAEQHAHWYGNPRSVYGMVNGITEVSQQLTTRMDDRQEIDEAAGLVLNMPF